MKLNRSYPIILTFLFLIGLIIHLNCTSREMAIKLTTPFLLVIGLFAVAIFLRVQKRMAHSFWAIAIVLFLTVSLEILGVQTGLIFGHYHYGSALGLRLKNVPLIIGLNWVVLIIATKSTVQLMLNGKLQKGILINFLAGLLLVLIDYFIEPVAVFLDYWQWEGGYIPLQNYLAWFFISQIAYFIIDLFKIKMKNKILSQLYLIMLCYFILLSILLEECS